MLRFSPAPGHVLAAKNGKALLWVLAAFALVLSGCQRRDAASAEPPAPPEYRSDTVAAQVRPGDTYSALLANLDLRPEVLQGLMQGISSHFPVKLYAGQKYSVVCERPREGGEPDLRAFVLDERGGLFKHALLRSEDTLSLRGDSLVYLGDSVAIRVDTVAVQGTLSTHLYAAVLEQGEKPALLDQLTQIFAWDIDFFRDPRVGDAFGAVVEKRWREDGTFLGYGQVLCARYVNQGHEFTGFRYRDGYYDAEGKSLEKLLMKAPLKFTRVSSGFTASRLHPVLGIRRPHWGIDYAGPIGTPIYAAGDGVVLTASWSGGFGHCVKIRHNSVYTTYYGHLNGYASGMRPGKRVKQGQVIGFLGKTGLASGPHLDYRVKKNDAFINPASLKTDAKEGITEAEKPDFSFLRSQLLALLDGPSGSKQQVVSSELPHRGARTDRPGRI